MLQLQPKVEFPENRDRLQSQFTFWRKTSLNYYINNFLANGVLFQLHKSPPNLVPRTPQNLQSSVILWNHHCITSLSCACAIADLDSWPLNPPATSCGFTQSALEKNTSFSAGSAVLCGKVHLSAGRCNVLFHLLEENSLSGNWEISTATTQRAR